MDVITVTASQTARGESQTEHSSTHFQPAVCHLQTDLVPGRLRATVRGGSAADHGGEYTINKDRSIY